MNNSRERKKEGDALLLAFQAWRICGIGRIGDSGVAVAIAVLVAKRIKQGIDRECQKQIKRDHAVKHTHLVWKKLPDPPKMTSTMMPFL